MLARYVRWLLASGFPVHDSDSGAERPVHAGDIAVLACVATNVRMLLDELDKVGVEYAARGGSLFLAHPVVRQYLLGLRALANRDDGVAEAALLRPPFFAVDCDDVAGSVLNRGGDTARSRVKEARDLVAALRARRHAQSPGATARDLIERTGLGRVVITGRNGAQTLAALYEVAAEVERRSALACLDYDRASEIVRSWALDPIFLDVADPIGERVLRVMTIDSAKDLEFPVIILWDDFQTLNGDRAGATWHAEREKQCEEERKRLYNVAATRARDLVAVPEPNRSGMRGDYASKSLLASLDATMVRRFETFRFEPMPDWAREVPEVGRRGIAGDVAMQQALDDLGRRFAAALQAAAQPVAVPTAVTAKAAGMAQGDAEIDTEAERLRKAAGGRFGKLFGAAVHRALELLAVGDAADAQGAVAIAMREVGANERADAAVEDVGRARSALVEAGIDAARGADIATEYPVCTLTADGQLLSGFIDLLAVDADAVTAIDFKTDIAPKAAAARVYPEYAAQLRLYGEMLRQAGVVGQRQLRLGLLFSETGAIHWI